MAAEAGPVRTRFAPSPTGRLHVGNLFVALHNWLFARACGGVLLLRLDDTDRARSSEAHAAAIEEDLAWLGLGWAARVRQSERLALYAAAADRLRQAGRLYPCYETEAELAAKRAAQRGRGRPPVYDRAALELGAAERARLEASGRRPHWRFLLEPETVGWEDLVRGRQKAEAASQSDPVLLRADGTPLYGLTSVVDDVDLGVTHVIRGSDHVTNTAAQIQLFRALGATPPAFGHLPLLVGVDGEPLSKRNGALEAAELRAAGIEPLTVALYLARLGTGEPMEPVTALEDLLAGYEIGRLGRASPRFDPAELAHLNARLLHALPFAAARERLAALGLAEADAAFWAAVRGNLQRLADARHWWQVCRGAIEPEGAGEDAALLETAAALLPPEPWDGETWRAWTARLGERTGRRGEALYRPLRLALTGRGEGPGMQALLPLIGRDRARRRLAAAAGKG